MGTAPLPEHGTRTAPANGFFGARIIAVAAAGQALGMGLVGVFQILVTPLGSEFGASASQLGAGMAIILASTGAASVAVALMADRGPLRTVMLCGVVAMVAATLGIASAESLFQLSLGAAAFGIATAMYGHIPANVLLVNWFEQRRGKAVAYAAMGMSVGGMLMPPAMTWLVDAVGWRPALCLLAVGAGALLLPLFARWMVRRPEDVGLLPDGKAPLLPSPRPDPNPGPPSPAGMGSNAKELLRSGNFWRLSLGLGLAMSVSVGLGAFLIPHLESLGISRQRAAFVPTTLAGCSFAAKPLLGACLDRFALKPVTAGILLTFALGWWLLSAASTLTDAVMAATVMGVGTGGLLVAAPVLMGATFGRDAIGQATGLQAPIGLPFILATPPLIGYVRDLTGSFQPAFQALSGVLVLGLLLLLSVRFAPRR